MKKLLTIMNLFLAAVIFAQNTDTVWYLKINEQGYVDRYGNELALDFDFDFLGFFHNGYAQIRVGDGEPFVIAGIEIRRTRRVLIDSNGKKVMDLSGYGLSNPFAIAGQDGWISVEDDKAGKKGIIRTDGTWIFEPKHYDFRLKTFEDTGKYYVEIPGRKSDYFYLNGEPVETERIEKDLTMKIKKEAEKMSGLYCFADQKDIPNIILGFGDVNGKTVIPKQFVHASDFSEGIAAVSRQRVGGFYYIDPNGNRVEEFPIAQYYGPFNDGIAVFKQNDRYGYIDRSGKVIIENKYDYVTTFYKGYAAVGMNETDLTSNSDNDYNGVFGRGNGVYGLINRKGELVCSMIYRGVPMIRDEYVARVEIFDEKEGYSFDAIIRIDKGGKILDRGEAEPIFSYKKPENPLF